MGFVFLAKFIGFSLSENTTLILTMIILIFVYTALLCSILFFFLGFNKKEVIIDEWKTKKSRGVNGGLIKTLSLELVSDRFK